MLTNHFPGLYFGMLPEVTCQVGRLPGMREQNSFLIQSELSEVEH